ncbi:hypothetical protein ACFO5Q_04610 [Kordiimonas lipolytica]|uniref:Trypsin-like peptidase domain-containing protein n=1 Tax=Kordiimonas lipolytica TaxID=1662421 RepID=A0ABV8U8K1_9PROT|nr:hypothetical protein [Kordiimonas lipolytica]
MRLSFLIFAVLLSMVGIAVQAQQIVAVEGDGQGQGVLRGYNAECYLITPQHVAGFAPQLRVLDQRRMEQTAVLQATYEPDIGLAMIDSKASRCSENWPDSRYLPPLLPKMSEGILLSRNNDGGLRRRFMNIIEFNDRWIYVRPSSGGDELFQGLSGSSLVVGDHLAGMLLHIDFEDGTGAVLRQDYIDAMLSTRFGYGSSGRNDSGSNNLLFDEIGRENGWLVATPSSRKGDAVRDADHLKLRFTGRGDGQANVQISQTVAVPTLSGLVISFDLSGEAYFSDLEFAGYTFDLLTEGGKLIKRLYASADSYYAPKADNSHQLNWRFGETRIRLDQVAGALNGQDVSAVRVSFHIETPRGETCRQCELRVKMPVMVYEK